MVIFVNHHQIFSNHSTLQDFWTCFLEVFSFEFGTVLLDTTWFFTMIALIIIFLIITIFEILLKVLLSFCLIICMTLLFMRVVPSLFIFSISSSFLGSTTLKVSIFYYLPCYNYSNKFAHNPLDYLKVHHRSNLKKYLSWSISYFAS